MPRTSFPAPVWWPLQKYAPLIPSSYHVESLTSPDLTFAQPSHSTGFLVIHPWRAGMLKNVMFRWNTCKNSVLFNSCYERSPSSPTTLPTSLYFQLINPFFFFSPQTLGKRKWILRNAPQLYISYGSWTCSFNRTSSILPLLESQTSFFLYY